jgi:hypothetical protein
MSLDGKRNTETAHFCNAILKPHAPTDFSPKTAAVSRISHV